MRYDELRQTLQELLASRERLRIHDEGLSPAAVLLLLYPRADEYHVLLTQRTSRVEHHKGEVSLPGGAWDHGETLAETALREAREEVGLEPSLVELLGTLDDITTRSNFVVTPHIGITRSTVEFAHSEHEVAALLEIPVRAFYDPAVHVAAADVEFAGRVVPGGHFRWGEAIVFGVTYRILRQFLDLVEPLDFWRSAVR
ncbi:MAG TPA: CoA pyrophosphatase [Dehalococcoidia bacterium]|nr:CoA pyrophosphatase [Dehalococcoidia bacterium]